LQISETRFWLGCYGYISHGTGNSAQVYENFGIWAEQGFEAPNPFGASLPCFLLHVIAEVITNISVTHKYLPLFQDYFIKK
jgi:hypothetical protein